MPPISDSCFSTFDVLLDAPGYVPRLQGLAAQRQCPLPRHGVIPEWDAFSEQQKTDYVARTLPKRAGVEACIETLE